MLVELLPKEEIKSAGGLVLSSGSDVRSSTKENQADLAIVLAVGEGYFDDTAEDDVAKTVPLDIQPGAVILVGRLGLKLYSQFPGLADYTSETIALTRDTEVHCAWPSVEVYEEYRARLNK